MITASRLASEKHVDWLIDAVKNARKLIPDVTLDIYGKGGEEEVLRKKIQRCDAKEYIRLCGQQNLTEVYKNYEAYISASTSEGFGLSLLEALGSGLPIIGFDVRYGNPNFIDDGKNGVLIPVKENMSNNERVKLLARAIIKLFANEDMDGVHEHSYEKAKEYLTEEVEKRWKNLLEKTI